MRSPRGRTEFWPPSIDREGQGLFDSDAAGRDIGAEIIFALHRRACQAAEHVDLSNVRKRIRRRALEKLLGRSPQRKGRGQVMVESQQGREETLFFLIPRERE